MKARKQETTTVREKMDMEQQVQEQLRAYRSARNIGHLEGMENTISGLFDIIGPWIPKDEKGRYLDTKYAPADISRFYTDEDRQDIDDYGELEDDRLKELKLLQSQHNRKEFYTACERRVGIIMDTFKKLGLGFEEEETAIIHYDKKKVTGPASR